MLLLPMILTVLVFFIHHNNRNKYCYSDCSSLVETPEIHGVVGQCTFWPMQVEIALARKYTDRCSTVC